MISWIIVFVIAIIGAFFDCSYSIGWIVGWGVMTLLSYLRERYYDKLLQETKVNLREYFAYILFTMVVIIVPVIGSFYISTYISPYAIMIGYFAYRMKLYLVGLFGGKHDSR